MIALLSRRFVMALVGTSGLLVAQMGWAQLPALDELIWQWVHPQPQGNALNDVATNGHRYVAVGEGGVAIYSGGLETFQLGETNTTRDLAGVVWNGKEFVALGGSRGDEGAGAAALISSDGRRWQESGIGLNVQVVAGLAFSGSRYVSRTNSRLIYSDSATKWEFGGALGFSATDVVWSGQEFVAVGTGGGVARSADGELIQVFDTGYDDNYNAVAADGETWVVAATRSVVTTSDGGASWSETLVNDGGAAAFWDGTHFYVFRTNGIFYTSPDGFAWTQRDPMPVVSGARSVSRVALGDSGYLAVGRGGAVYSSKDSMTWVDRLKVEFSLTLQSVDWNGERFVAGASDLTTGVLSSQDGRSWDVDASLAGAGILDVHWDGDQFLAVGLEGQGRYSPDGLLWTGFQTGSDKDLYGIVRGGGLYLAVGDDGNIQSSTDLQSWQSHTSGTSQRLNAVIWTGDRFVAAGRGNALITSLDGMEWNALSAPVSGTISTLVTNGEVHLIGNDVAGVAGISFDGVDWAPVDTGGPGGESFDGLWTGTEFVLMSGAGFRISPDGLNWRSIPSIGTSNGRAIAGGGTTYVVVGATGTILRSAPPVIFQDAFGG